MQQQPTTLEQALARIAELEASKTAKAGLKVSAKGAVSLYGIQRFPVTFYASQWETILGKAEEIKAFIEANRSALATKE